MRKKNINEGTKRANTNLRLITNNQNVMSKESWNTINKFRSKGNSNLNELMNLTPKRRQDKIMVLRSYLGMDSYELN